MHGCFGVQEYASIYALFNAMVVRRRPPIHLQVRFLVEA